MQTICKQNETYYGNANHKNGDGNYIAMLLRVNAEVFFGRTQQFYERTLGFSWDTDHFASKLKVSATLHVDGPLWTYQRFSGKCTRFVSARKCTEINFFLPSNIFSITTTP